MTKTNYRLLMERELALIQSAGRTPRLLLHVCCAPCASGCLEELCAVFDVTCFYYNPNIFPKEEYDRRADELARLARVMPLRLPPRVETGDYDRERFEALAQGMEALPEGGERCMRCYRLRLSETANKARAGAYDYFTTTLSVSPYKNAAKLNEIGGELAEAYGVKWLFSDFKKNNGYLRSIQNSREYGLYRQNYCGCVYSRLQAEKKHQAGQIQDGNTGAP